MKKYFHLLAFFCVVLIALPQCEKAPADISGHWHLSLVNDGGNDSNNSSWKTLDIYENQFAFFNKDQLNFPDRKFYLRYEAGETIPLANVDSVEKNITPFGSEAVSFFQYTLQADGQLLLSTEQGPLFLAQASKDCSKDDYCKLNPYVQNWCGMVENLPEFSIDPMATYVDTFPSVDIYLGFLEKSEINGVEQQIVLNFNKEIDFIFSDVSDILKALFDKYQDFSPGNILAELRVDAQMPYYVFDYLQSHLRQHSMLKVAYVTASETKMITRLPPFVEDDCDPFFGRSRPCLSKRIITKEEQATLDQQQLNPEWAPVIKYSEFKLKPENLFIVDVLPGNEITLNGKPVVMDSLSNLARQFLLGSGNPASKIFKISVDGHAGFGTYLEAHTRIRSVYGYIWNEKALELFDTDYDSLTMRQRSDVRTKIPLVIWIVKK